MTDCYFAVRWLGIDGTVRKYDFEPTRSGHIRIEREWDGANWRVVGREPVADVAIEASEGTVEFPGDG